MLPGRQYLQIYSKNLQKINDFVLDWPWFVLCSSLVCPLFVLICPQSLYLQILSQLYSAFDFALSTYKSIV